MYTSVMIGAIYRSFTKANLISVATLLVVIIIIIVTSWTLYTQTVLILTQNLRERLLTISITQAANISADDINALQTESDWMKPEWAKVVEALHKAKYNNSDVVFMYIFRYTLDPNDDPQNMEFVADADSIDPYANQSGDPSRYVDVNRDGKIEPDGPDKLQWPGQPYPEAIDIPEVYTAYTEPLTASDLYSDEYGTVLTGYAPIKDGYGNTIAVLATDIKADDFFNLTRQTLEPFLLFIATLSIIISVLMLALIAFWRRNARFLESVNVKLQSLDKLKNEFLSIATHQLRTPLGPIMGYASMIKDGSYGPVSPEIVGVLNNIIHSGQLMSTTIDDFLDVSKIEQGKLDLDIKTFDLRTVVNEVAGEMQIIAQLKNLKLDLTIAPIPVMVNADYGKIKHAVSNLVDNSIKYTTTGSIKVSVGTAQVPNQNQKQKMYAEIQIVDTGVGIDPAEITTLFEKFVRGKDAHGINSHGSGLGLYVASEMIKAHGGHIIVTSAGKGAGSTFIVHIPLAVATAQRS